MIEGSDAQLNVYKLIKKPGEGSSLEGPINFALVEDEVVEHGAAAAAPVKDEQMRAQQAALRKSLQNEIEAVTAAALGPKGSVPRRTPQPAPKEPIQEGSEEEGVYAFVFYYAKGKMMVATNVRYDQVTLAVENPIIRIKLSDMAQGFHHGMHQKLKIKAQTSKAEWAEHRRHSTQFPYVLSVEGNEFYVTSNIRLKAKAGQPFPCGVRALKHLKDLSGEQRAQLGELVRAAKALTSDQGAAAGQPSGAGLKAKQQGPIPEGVTANAEQQLHMGAAR